MRVQLIWILFAVTVYSAVARGRLPEDEELKEIIELAKVGAKYLHERESSQPEEKEENIDVKLGASETGGHGDDIDNPNVDKNSELENILESQKVFGGNVAERPENLHEKDKDFEKEQENEIFFGEEEGGSDEDDEEEDSEEMDERNFASWYSFQNNKLWPHGVVPYAVDEASYGDKLSTFYDKLEKTINIFDTETCISFQPKNDSLSESLGHNNFVTFFKGSGCYSPLGVSRGKISLTIPGCSSIRTFFHEMGHTLGMLHEQSRTDRNSFMTINWKNIIDGKEGNFFKSSTNIHDDVDPYSAMQYYLWAFNKNKLRTITLRDRDYDFLVTASRSYSFYDIADINGVYKCAENCTVKPACEHFGFVNKDCECRCPKGLRGPVCNAIGGNCGRFINLTSGESQNITSPNWPDKYDVNLKCVWMITAPKNHRIKVTILDIDLAHTTTPRNRCYHWLELHGNLIGEPGIKRCGWLWPDAKSEYFHVINNEANEMMIGLDSLYASEKTPGNGFRLEVTAFKSGCLSMPCKMGGACEEGNNDFTYKCICPAGYSGVNCEYVTANATVTCDFEIDFGDHCFLKNILKWTVDKHEGSVKANDSGVFAKVAKHNAPAVMVSDVDFEASERCLSFDYYNSAARHGTIKIYYESNDFEGRREAFETLQNDTWQKANVHFPEFNGLKITFEGEYGNGGVKAVDNVMLVPGPCGVPCTLSNPCLNGGVCIAAEDKKSFTCDCVNGYKGQLCETASNKTTFTCNFEPNEPCFLEEDDTDDINWDITAKGTGSSGTGPSAPFQGEYYKFVEASFIDKGSKARLVNSLRDLPEGQRCLIFHYSMYGADMGSLNIKTIQNGGEITATVWSKSGNQGLDWNKATIALPPVPRLNVEIEGVVGSNYRSDIGIDNVILRPGRCGCDSDPCLNGGSCITTGDSYTCSCVQGYGGAVCDYIENRTVTATFEDGTFGFLERDDNGKNYWIFRQGGTPSGGTGPSGAAEGVKYVYLEASYRKRDEVDGLISSDIFTNNMPRCLQFSYNMYGATVGALNIKIVSDNSTSTVWTKRGNQGTSWKRTVIGIPIHTENYRVVFEGVVGNDYRSDIAIDDISMQPRVCGCASNPCKNGGSCTENPDYSYTCQCTAGFAGDVCDVIDTATLLCTYESGDNCFLSQAKDDNKDWIIKQGKTPSGGTGPEAAQSGSRYIYMETSFRNTGEKDRLITTNQFISRERCLSFYYHMYGGSMGTLRIFLNDGQEVFKKSGNQGNEWTFAEVDIPELTDLKITIEGTRGNGYTGDIALDNITLEGQKCGNLPAKRDNSIFKKLIHELEDLEEKYSRSQ